MSATTTLYDLKLVIEAKEEELEKMKDRLERECSHPLEFLKKEQHDNNPDPLQVEVRYTWNECQLCGTKWKSNEKEKRNGRWIETEQP